MTRDQAIERAVLLTKEKGVTACVFIRRTKYKGEIVEEFTHGSAYEKAPKGYKPAVWVSVTGLIREVGSI